jgi:hypothetical protein
MSQFKSHPGPAPRCPWHNLVLSRIYPDVWICPSEEEHPLVDEFATQKMQVEWAGAMLSIHRAIEERKASAKATDPTQTTILPHWAGDLPVTDETWHTEAPSRRRHTHNVFQRLLHKLFCR